METVDVFVDETNDTIQQNTQGLVFDHEMNSSNVWQLITLKMGQKLLKILLWLSHFMKADIIF